MFDSPALLPLTNQFCPLSKQMLIGSFQLKWIPPTFDEDEPIMTPPGSPSDAPTQVRL